MSKGFMKVLGVLGGLTLLGLNITFVAFFALWQIADSTSINQMETATGVDPAQMLPSANLMWIAAHALFFMVLGADALAIVFAVMLRKSRHRSRSMAGIPSRESVLKR